MATRFSSSVTTARRILEATRNLDLQRDESATSTSHVNAHHHPSSDHFSSTELGFSSLPPASVGSTQHPSVAHVAAELRDSLKSVGSVEHTPELRRALREPADALVVALNGKGEEAVRHLLPLGDVLENIYDIHAEHPGLIDPDEAWETWGALYRQVQADLERVDPAEHPEAAAAIDKIRQVEARRYFADVSREQWTYYADNVNAATSFLPPDNVSLGGDEPQVDARTSPTNIGLYMQATVVASRLGFIDQQEMLGRLRDTVDTISALPKYTSVVVDAHGNEHTAEHLFNWYSLDGDPREIGEGFISTVDNGNFVSDLMGVITAIGDADPELSRDLTEIVDKMRFDVLFDEEKGLLYHGAYANEDGSLRFTPGHYDMVISEARSAYWAGIAKGEIPASSWRNLKPKLDQEIDDLNVDGELQFQSYFGTMFEYMAHSSSMRLEGTPLGEADRQAVERQMEDTAGGLWGRSEANSNTPEEYAAWGASSLALSRHYTSSGHDVIAPYASQLATHLAPLEVAENLHRMEQAGLRSRYGFMESCTVSDSDGGEPKYEIASQVYAHHTGWGLRSMAAHLLNGETTGWLHDSIYNHDGVLERLLATPVEAYRQPSRMKDVAPAGPEGAYGAGPEGAYGTEYVHRRPPEKGGIGAALLEKGVRGLVRVYLGNEVDDASLGALTATIEKYGGRFDLRDCARLIKQIRDVLRKDRKPTEQGVPSWMPEGVSPPVDLDDLTRVIDSPRIAHLGRVDAVQEVIDLIKTEGILAGMNVEQKARQMSTYTWTGAVTGPTGGSSDNIQTSIRKGAGALFNVTTAEDANRLQEISKSAGNEAPLLLGFDAISGFKTAGPIPLLQGCSFNPQVAEAVSLVAGLEAYLHGNRQTFAPMVDESRSGPLWARWVETYGAGPFLIGVNAVMSAKGFKRGGLQTTAKHMLGYGYADIDYGSADMSDRTIDELLLPYRLLEESGYLDWVMPGFNTVKGRPATHNEWLLKDVLRGELGSDAVVVSDYNAVSEAQPYGTASSTRKAATDAALAGVEMAMQDGSFANHLPQAVEDGDIPEEILDNATRRILRMKAKAGLLDENGGFSNPEKAEAFCLSDAVRQVMYWAAVQSMVLLENKALDDGEPILPLASTARRIALVGPLAKDRDAPMGQWKADAKAEDTVSIFDAFESGLLDGQTLSYAKGSNVIGARELSGLDREKKRALLDDEKRMLDEALEEAAQSDVVVLALGTTREMSGEARSRSNPSLPTTQIELVERIKEETGKPVVVVLQSGLPLTGMQRVQEAADAVLWAGHAGSEAGNAVRNILYGDENPSGHLAFEWSEHPADYRNDRYDRLRTGRSQPETEPVTNLYVAASKDEALDADGNLTALDQLTPGRGVWVAGRGLSYTTFSMSDFFAPERISAEQLARDGGVEVQVTVRNTGDRTGEEVVQIYMRDEVSSEVQPEKLLVGFEKVRLEPGEEKQITIVIPTERFAYFSEVENRQVLERGEFKLWAGQHSRDTAHQAVLRVDG